MKKLYPLKFKPVFKDKIWGGHKIRTSLGLDFGNLPNCGEAWVLSGVKDNETTVKEGWLAGNSLNELVEVFMDDLVGEKVYEKHGDEFPILIKFIDSNEWLSIQVHPDDKLAAKRHRGRGKTEMWYIIDAEPRAQLINGFNRPVSREEYLNHLRQKRLPGILNYENVEPGDVFFMPSGSVHALGPGVLLAEIQQTSDITYRIFDWDRVDSKGVSRELHTDLALDAINFNPSPENRIRYPKQANKTISLVNSPYFTTRMLWFNQPVTKIYDQNDSFVIYIVLSGPIAIKYDNGFIRASTGECILIPHLIDEIRLIPEREARLLEVFMA